jgi:membrane fusion protein (multidrug efflux system)
VSVEEAELKAQEAQAALAKTVLDRRQSLNHEMATTQEEVDRAHADLDVARAQIARTKAIIARKTIRAPFRSRVGIADVHPGQYLNEGTLLTTLQGIDDAAHVDFTVAQQVAAGLREGELVEVFAGSPAPITAKIVALDARIDPATRNAAVRARIEGSGNAPSPGSSVRVRIPVGASRKAVAVPVSALRKGPEGDQVFVIRQDQDGRARAHVQPVESGAMFGDEVVIHAGLIAGEQVAASGSFKLREAALVAVAGAQTHQSEQRQTVSQH